MRREYSVTEVNRYVRSTLASEPFLMDILVKGEVSNCKYASSGHIYFSLKDEKSVISCVMFRSDRAGLDFPMKDGMEVVAHGRIGVYEAGGRYQLYANQILRRGTGALYQQLEILTKKLKAEGLFDFTHKKTVPYYARSLGIVTSRTGAVVHDIETVARRRNPGIQLVFCPAQVQGQGAAESIVRAIRTLDAAGVDVMIVGRGGGSIEELWEFNKEIVARAVYACRTPVISAVGHDINSTVIDSVADLAAATPSEAAEKAVRETREIFMKMESYRSGMNQLMRMRLDTARSGVKQRKAELEAVHPRQLLDNRRQKLSEIEERMDEFMRHRLDLVKTRRDSFARELGHAMQRKLDRARSSRDLYEQRLYGLSPLRMLERGYAYVTDIQGHAVSGIAKAAPGDVLKIEVTDGEIEAQVRSVRPVRRK